MQEHILACLSSSPSNPKIIRTAARMAEAFGGIFTALYVQTPDDTKRSGADKQRLEAHMKLAEDAGADIVIAYGDDVPYQIAEYARLSGVTKIVLGRSSMKRQHFWSKPTLTERVTEIVPGMDIHIIPDAALDTEYRQPRFISPDKFVPQPGDLLLTALILAAATFLGSAFLKCGFTESSIITVYLLSVLLISVFTRGYTCSSISAVLGVVLFNYFLTEPRLTLHAYGSGYPVTFATMLAASVITGTLASRLKDQAKLSALAAYRTQILFDANQLLQKAGSGQEIMEITGILNGTTNYMLTKMSNDHMDFAEVLKEAQEKGYAESDPTADVGGFDAARKIAILASIGFNSRVVMDDVSVEGIQHISLRDIEYAKELDYVIKLLGIAKQYDNKKISVGVHPTMLPKNHPLASINDVFNAVYIEGKPIGEAMFFGRGAGRFPTASAACGDIIEISRNIRENCTGRVGCTCYETTHLAEAKEIESPYYVRVLVEDEPGVLATIAGAFGDYGVSLKTVVQKRSIGDMAEIVIITKGVSEYNMKLASDALKRASCVDRISNIIRVEDPSLLH